MYVTISLSWGLYVTQHVCCNALQWSFADHGLLSEDV